MKHIITMQDAMKRRTFAPLAALAVAAALSGCAVFAPQPKSVVDTAAANPERSGGQIRLIAENPDFEPIIVSPDADGFAIEGLAVGLIRNNMLM